MALRLRPSPRHTRATWAPSSRARALRRPVGHVQASLVTTAALALAAIPASVAVDELLDRATDRVGRVANAATPAGTRLYVARPQASTASSGGDGRRAGGKRPAVVLIHQIFGLQPREAGLCDDLAARGYVAVAPDTFGGAASTWIPRALAVAYPRALAPGASWGVGAVADAVAWLKQQPDVDPERVAVCGFCYGGGSALRFAAAHTGQAAAVGVFYGRPLQAAAAAAAPAAAAAGGASSSGGGSSVYAPLAGVPVYAVYGGRDSQFPAAVVDEFEAGLKVVDAPAAFKRYPSQGHAFISDAAAANQAGSDAADAWGGWADFLATHLGAPAS